MYSTLLRLFPLLLLWKVSFGTTENIIVTVIPDINNDNQNHFRLFNGTPYDENVVANGLGFDAQVRFYSCDVDYARQLLYAYDGFSGRIYVFSGYDPVSMDYADLERFHDGIFDSVYVKIAVDWISNNVYWVDELHQWIAVQPGTNRDSNQTLYRVIVDSDLDTPTGLAVDPIYGYLFWSNIGSSTKIERSTLSGANRQSIIYQGLGMPLGIAVDQSEPRIYWVDYIRDTIESADFDGRNRNILRRISHSMFYDIALYKESIIVTDFQTEKVLFLSKTTGEIQRYFNSSGELYHGVAMFSDETQPSATDRCQFLNCDDFCISGGTSDYECVCRTGYKLNIDRRSCTEDFGTLHRAIVIASTTDICMLSIHSLSSSYRYFCLRDVTSGIGSTNRILFLDIDSNIREFIYATRYTVEMVGTDGRNLLTLARTSRPITGLSLDWVERNVYLSLEGSGGSSEGQIDVLSIPTRTFLTLLFDDPLVQPRYIAVDPHTGFLYWIAGEVDSTIIEKAKLDGSGRSVIVTSGEMDTPTSLVLDLVDQQLYWVDRGYVYRSRVDGSDFTRLDIDHTAFFITPELIIVYKGFLLWTGDVTSNSSKIFVHQKKGSLDQQHELTPNYLGQIKILKYIDPALQKPEPGPCQLFNGGCEHICIPNGQVSKCLCEFGFRLAADGKSCSSTTLLDNFILLTDWTHNKIYQVSLVNDETVGLRTTESPVGVAFDLQTGQVIWGVTSDSAIRRMFLNGSMEEVLIDTDFFHDAHPDRFAIDYASGNIFYTSVPVRSNGFVGVGVVTRGGKHRKIITYGESPRAIALDLQEGLMFWSDHGLHEVFRANIDGTDSQTLTVSSDLRWPNGIAIDHQEKQIYVTDGYTNKIFRCSYTGPCYQVYSDLDAWLTSIFLSGEYLYYTSWNNPFITKIDKATFMNKIRLSNNPEHGRLDDIFVYDSSKSTPPVHDICSQNNGRGPCSTFCLPKGKNSYTCACEDNVDLTSDGHRCKNVQLATTISTRTATSISSSNPTKSTAVATTTTTLQDEPVTNKQSGDMAVFIGSAVGGLVLVLCVIVVIVIVYRRRNTKPRTTGRVRLPDSEYTVRDDACVIHSIYDKIPADHYKSEAPGLPARGNSYTDMSSRGLSGYEKLRHVPRNQTPKNNTTVTPQQLQVVETRPEQEPTDSPTYLEFIGSSPQEFASDDVDQGALRIQDSSDSNYISPI